MKTAAYVRISSWRKNEFDSQEDDIKRWAANQGKELEWYRDIKSGATMVREDFERMMYDVRLGDIRTIVVWRLDRLGRTALGLLQLIEELDKYKCNLVSLRDNVDLSTPSGRLHFTLLASVAQFERECQGERQRAGIAAAKARGVVWKGRKKGAFEKISPANRKEIMQLVGIGVAKTRIAKQFGICRQHLYRILEQERN